MKKLKNLSYIDVSYIFFFKKFKKKKRIFLKKKKKLKKKIKRVFFNFKVYRFFSNTLIRYINNLYTKQILNYKLPYDSFNYVEKRNRRFLLKLNYINWDWLGFFKFFFFLLKKKKKKKKIKIKIEWQKNISKNFFISYKNYRKGINRWGYEDIFFLTLLKKNKKSSSLKNLLFLYNIKKNLKIEKKFKNRKKFKYKQVKQSTIKLNKLCVFCKQTSLFSKESNFTITLKIIISLFYNKIISFFLYSKVEDNSNLLHYNSVKTNYIDIIYFKSNFFYLKFLSFKFGDYLLNLKILDLNVFYKKKKLKFFFLFKGILINNSLKININKYLTVFNKYYMYKFFNFSRLKKQSSRKLFLYWCKKKKKKIKIFNSLYNYIDTFFSKGNSILSFKLDYKKITNNLEYNNSEIRRKKELIFKKLKTCENISNKRKRNRENKKKYKALKKKNYLKNK